MCVIQSRMRKNIQVIDLTEEDQQKLHAMSHKGTWKAREILHARILLMAHTHPQMTNEEVAQYLECGRETVRRVRDRYRKDGIEAALHDKPRSGAPRRLTGEEEATLVATMCTTPPDGHDHWTLQLLADHFEEETHKHIGTATVYRVEVRNEQKPWQKKGMGNSSLR
jgi:putative transposase